ncbi:hypothetical protein MIS24_15535 [Vibrio parahaemolyticus]|nr:hypothetical protein [Vibrio parahaemolyticus]
MAFLLCVGFSG